MNLEGVYISDEKFIPVNGETKILFSSGRKCPKKIRGKFIVREWNPIGLVHIEDQDGEYTIPTHLLADPINTLFSEGRIKQLALTKINEAKVLKKPQVKKPGKKKASKKSATKKKITKKKITKKKVKKAPAKKKGKKI